MSSVGTDIVSSISAGINNGKNALTSAAKSVASAMVDAVKGKGSDFTSVGKTLATKLVDGIKGQKTSASDAGKALGNEAKSGARNKYNDMYTAGTYLGSGFIAGIASKAEAAYKAGYALGQAAAQGVEDGEEAASPSKRGIQAGKWLGEGFIIGMNRMNGSVYKAGMHMSGGAVESITRSVSSISKLVESGMDSNPTIRPVLDLSDIKSGVSTMSGLLSFDSAVGVLANVGSINTMMSRRNQNRGNDDLINAINKLGKELGKTGGDTYQVNGVTYDDGSDIKNFAQAVIRQARIERRV
jgi:hypothetical protein